MSDPHPLALPTTLSPDTLDVLTHLSTILSEVRTNLQASAGLDTDGTSEKKDGGTPAAGGLTFKDVARASDVVKHKLQRAREQVRSLPDMSRSIAEQEEEMRALETRIERQRALLMRLHEEGGSAVDKDVDGARGGVCGDKMEL